MHCVAVTMAIDIRSAGTPARWSSSFGSARRDPSESRGVAPRESPGPRRDVALDAQALEAHANRPQVWTPARVTPQLRPGHAASPMTIRLQCDPDRCGASPTLTIFRMHQMVFVPIPSIDAPWRPENREVLDVRLAGRVAQIVVPSAATAAISAFSVPSRMAHRGRHRRRAAGRRETRIGRSPSIPRRAVRTPEVRVNAPSADDVAAGWRQITCPQRASRGPARRIEARSSRTGSGQFTGAKFLRFNLERVVVRPGR